MPHVALLSEDFFRFGANGAKANPETLLELVRRIRQIPQVGLIQIDHASMASVAQYEDSQLQAIHDLLVGQNAQVESLADQRLAIFPVLYAPVDGSPPLDPSRLRPLHWALIRACYRLNFRWVPWFYRDQQAAAGVPLVRRMTMQLLGYGQVLQWKSLLAWHQWRARR